MSGSGSLLLLGSLSYPPTFSSVEKASEAARPTSPHNIKLVAPRQSLIICCKHVNLIPTLSSMQPLINPPHPYKPTHDLHQRIVVATPKLMCWRLQSLRRSPKLLTEDYRAPADLNLPHQTQALGTATTKQLLSSERCCDRKPLPLEKLWHHSKIWCCWRIGVATDEVLPTVRRCHKINIVE